jgi:transposase
MRRLTTPSGFLCADARVNLVYLPPHSPDLNPTEEIFDELKGFTRRNWGYYVCGTDQGFGSLLERLH